MLAQIGVAMPPGNDFEGQGDGWNGLDGVCYCIAMMAQGRDDWRQTAAARPPAGTPGPQTANDWRKLDWMGLEHRRSMATRRLGQDGPCTDDHSSGVCGRCKHYKFVMPSASTNGILILPGEPIRV